MYTVWVNGIRIADVGSFQSRSYSTVARTRTFPIPKEAAGSRGPLQIAIQFDWFMGGGAHLQAEQSAPYLVTYRENAPVTAGVKFKIFRIEEPYFLAARVQILMDFAACVNGLHNVQAAGRSLQDREALIDCKMKLGIWKPTYA